MFQHRGAGVRITTRVSDTVAETQMHTYVEGFAQLVVL